MRSILDGLAPIGGGRLGADLAADPGRRRIELPPAVRDGLVEMTDKRAGHAAAPDDMAPKGTRATTEFVSRLRDIRTGGRSVIAPGHAGPSRGGGHE
jgi:hypothetical protein